MAVLGDMAQRVCADLCGIEMQREGRGRFSRRSVRDQDFVDRLGDGRQVLPTRPAPSASARWHRRARRPGHRIWGPAPAQAALSRHNDRLQAALGQGQAERQPDHAAALKSPHPRASKSSPPIALKKCAKLRYFAYISEQIRLPVFESPLAHVFRQKSFILNSLACAPELARFLIIR